MIWNFQDPTFCISSNKCIHSKIFKPNGTAIVYNCIEAIVLDFLKFCLVILDTGVFRLDTGVFRLDTRVFRLDTRVFRLDTRVFRLDTRVLRLHTRVFRLDTQVFRLDTRVFRLDTRVFRLDTRVFWLDTRVFWLDTRVFWLYTRDFRPKTRVFRLDTRGFRLDTFQTRYSSFQTRYSSFQTRYSSFQTGEVELVRIDDKLNFGMPRSSSANYWLVLFRVAFTLMNRLLVVYVFMRSNYWTSRRYIMMRTGWDWISKTQPCNTWVLIQQMANESAIVSLIKSKCIPVLI